MLRDSTGRWFLAEREGGRTVAASSIDDDVGCSFSHERSAWALGGPLPQALQRRLAAGAVTAGGGAWICLLRNHRGGTELTIEFDDAEGHPIASRRQRLFHVRRMPFGLGEWLLSLLRWAIRPFSR